MVLSFRTEAVTSFGLMLRSVMHDKCYEYTIRAHIQTNSNVTQVVLLASARVSLMCAGKELIYIFHLT